MSRAGRVLTGLVVALAVSSGAGAHTIGLSRGDYVAGARGLDAVLVFARGELLLLEPAADVDRDGVLSAAEIEGAAPALARAVGNRVLVTSGVVPCAIDRANATAVTEDGLEVSVAYDCADAGAATRIELALLDELSLGHRHVAQVEGDGRIATAILHTGASAIEPAAALAAGEPASDGAMAGAATSQVFAFGVEHILTGYDHLLFVLALLVGCTRWRTLVAILTSFTLAHSLTLALATLQWLVPPAALIEPAIALTIAWVGVENWRTKDHPKRWLLAFGFGLIHGFGFAGAMGEVDLAPDRFWTWLLTFNLGVEAGQLAVVAVAAPALVALRRTQWFPRQGVAVVNAAVVACGLAWFAERTLFG